MEKQEDFLKALEELKDIAATRQNKLSLEEIKQYFPDFAKDDQKMELIYKYFMQNQIKIIEREDEFEPQESVFDEREEKVLQMYLEELGEIKILSEKAQKEAIRKMLEGDEEAKILLIESNLKLVTDIAKQYRNRGLALGDLIQEGNMGLLQEITQYDESGDAFDKFAEKAIRTGIEQALNLQKKNTDVSIRLANKVNDLDEVCQDLARELGREARLEEVADKMHISEEEVRELMKISLDAISVLEPNMNRKNYTSQI